MRLYGLVCTALLLAFFLGLRFMIYGISDEFGIGFGLGAGTGALLAALGAHIEYKERLKALEERERF